MRKALFGYGTGWPSLTSCACFKACAPWLIPARPRSAGFWRIAISTLVLTVGVSALHAQFGPLLSSRRAPQAKTQEELDLYLEIYTGGVPDVKVRTVRLFAEAYPTSEFLGLAYQYQMAAYRDLSDYEGVLEAGQKALGLLPDNLNTLLTLATVIPNGVEGRADREELLSRAERFASSVLSKIETTKIPAEIGLDQWESRKVELSSDAREALGHIAVKRGDLDEALRQFQSAVNINPSPKPSLWYRLGGTYLLMGRQEQALEPLRRAAATGGQAVRRLALDQLRRLAQAGVH